VAVARCSTVGPVLLDPRTRKPSWAGTLFEAARQAAEGTRWPQQEATPAPATRRTQGRHVDRAGLLLGVHPDLDDDERERIAARLRVPTLTVRQAAATGSCSWTARGAAILCVLAAVPVDASLLDRLLSAGYAARLWAWPRRRDLLGRLVAARLDPFADRSDEAEHPPPPEAVGRSPPSTKSRGAQAPAPAAPSPP
jgi:hypothetical protein